jgi:adenosylcobinamide-GDP ribazoletransferase
MRLPPPLRGARAAFLFLTRIPVGGAPYSEEDWRWAGGWFPFVGLCLGLLLAGVWKASSLFGAWPTAALVLGAGMLATGGLHEDGLADTADALGGGTSRERILEILKDSRVGTFGAAALAISFLLRAGCWVELSERAASAMVLSHCLSRAPPVWLMAVLPYVSGTGAKSRQVARSGWAQVALATSWPLALLALGVGMGWIRVAGAAVLVGASAVLAAACAARFRARVGGITGDFLGATQQVVECAICLALVAQR